MEIVITILKNAANKTNQSESEIIATRRMWGHQPQLITPKKKNMLFGPQIPMVWNIVWFMWALCWKAL